jgi:CheY-like chemotaxis protein
MKILIVEDDFEYVKNIQATLCSIRDDIEFSFAENRNAAIESIDKNFYDLMVLDLKIPTDVGELDEEPEHGYAVFEFARRRAPGTPLFVLTGSPAESFIEKLQENISQVDIWGSGQLPSTRFLAKHKYGSKFKEMITPYLDGYGKLMDVELQGGDGLLSIVDNRILRIFSSKQRAVKCVVRILSGGLSGAKVVRLTLTNDTGAHILEGVAKIGLAPEVASESQRFDTHVIRLAGGATPRKLALVEYGAADSSGIFYSMAVGYESDAFKLAILNDKRSSNVVKEIKALTDPWRSGLPEARKEIRSLRRLAISDKKLEESEPSFPFDWILQFEGRQIQTRYGCCHGDLHGMNVLASPEGDPILIDYGDVGDTAASWDPVTLELSLLFHPEGPLRGSPWPTADQAQRWGELDVYLVNCPYPIFVRSCREWAIEVAAGHREVAACAYSYLVRQTKYTKDRDLIFSLMAGAKNLFDIG